MHISKIAWATLIGSACATPVLERADDLGTLLTLAGQAATAVNQMLSTPEAKTGSCTAQNLVVRKPWDSLSSCNKIAYTNAVRCLQNLPAKTPQSLVPGVRSRFDDFLATHINQTLSIHYTGNFLAWHRWFVFQYELALKTECGYHGAQPYWNWALFTEDLPGSSIFDGSATSMSGNGEAIADKGPIILTLGAFDPVVLPPGTGGGCVTSGPFKDMQVNLGPVSLPLNNGTVLTGTGLEFNPRCLKRDLSTEIVAKFSNATQILNLIQQNTDIANFQLTMQGVPGSGSIGVHGGGHYSIGGDPAGDVFTSPGDPVFYLHHGMIDLVWWVWQHIDLPNRQSAIAATNTFLDLPPSANTTLDDIIDLGYAGGGPITMRELMSTTEGPFCYVYSV